MERERRQLECDADHQHEAAEDQGRRLPRFKTARLLKQAGQPDRHRRQMGRAEHADQQAHAIEHDPGRGRTENGVFHRRFARLGLIAFHARQHVARHACHLDAQ